MRPRERKSIANDRLPEQLDYIGVLTITWRGGYVVPSHKQFKHDIFIPDHLLGDARNGDKVKVHLTQWKRYKEYPEGEIIQVIGKSGDNDTEMHSILMEYGLPFEYPQKAIKEAETIDEQISQKEILRRKDMRDVITFTIDPQNAKDFDDAISIRSIDSEDKPLYEIGVHIADVTHYVQPDSLLDKEAYSRGTSIYLVDRVVPMLPERLSNGICSLRPKEDKLCFSVIFNIDDEANVIKYSIKKTVINSDRRFTYEEAQQRIETGEGDFAAELQILNRLAQILRTRRFDAGAVDFQKDEVTFELDENGSPISITFQEHKESNQLIEEFMLLANRTVAEYMNKKETAPAFVYRVHDLPDPDRLTDLSKFVKSFGYKLDPSARKHSSYEMNKLLRQVSGKPEQDLILLVALRSMAKAIYSTKNIGHYGLAFKYYTHFTSPIRRYPDMMVHRLLWQNLKGKRGADRDQLEEQCEHCSQQEQLATNAERASIKYKQVEFMQDHLGQVFEAIVSSVTDYGMFIEVIENKCEGLVPIRTINYYYDDTFFLDEHNYTLEGINTYRRIRIGDKVKVVLTNANLEKKQLDFELA